MLKIFSSSVQFEVSCCVPVEDESAVVAVEHSDPERQFGFHRTTGRTGLRRRIEPIDRDHMCATVGAFGGEDLTQLA
jgi:hypothetical protein